MFDVLKGREQGPQNCPSPNLVSDFVVLGQPWVAQDFHLQCFQTLLMGTRQVPANLFRQAQSTVKEGILVFRAHTGKIYCQAESCKAKELKDGTTADFQSAPSSMKEEGF